MSRRFWTRALLLGAGATLMPLGRLFRAAEIKPSAQKSRVILLGTGGGPVLGGARRMSANAVIVGEDIHIIDCGYGVVDDCIRAGLALRNLRSVCITHNHADHNIEYGALLFFAWLYGLKQPLDVYGPQPIKHMTDLLIEADSTALRLYKDDMAMGSMPPVIVHELSGRGVIVDEPTIKISCTLVEHPPAIPAFGYRFDLADRSVVFSGDTAPCDALVDLAQGATMMVHEACDPQLTAAAARKALEHADPLNLQGTRAQGQPPANFDLQRFVDHMRKAHSSVEDAARIAARANVKTLVLSHLSPSSPQVISDSVWRERAARYFKGEIIVGRDGMEV